MDFTFKSLYSLIVEARIVHYIGMFGGCGDFVAGALLLQINVLALGVQNRIDLLVVMMHQRQGHLYSRLLLFDGGLQCTWLHMHRVRLF